MFAKSFAPAAGSVLAGLLALVLAACETAAVPVAPDEAAFARAQGRSTSAEMNRTLAEIRRATARYHRVEAAIADGYHQESPCISSPIGAMGIHFVNEAYMDGAVDPSRPEMLVYEPDRHGRLRLVAVEFMIPAALWGETDPPALAGQPYDDLTVNFPPHLGPHYALHAWVWRDNPLGVFAPFNPKVTCP